MAACEPRLEAGRVRIEREGGVAVIVIDNPPVNAGSREVRAGLLAAVQEVTCDRSIGGVVLIGAGRSFVAGSDIREFEGPLGEPQLPEVLRAIAMSPKPFVAAIHGAALGGGFELALACDLRIAASGAQVGLPEATLGMIPGAGGTQHMPRLVGIAKAIELICAGRPVTAAEALRLGLVDAIAQGDLRQLAVARAGKHGLGKRPLGLDTVPPDPPGAITAAEKDALRSGRARPHLIAAIAAVKEAATEPYEVALAHERSVFQALRGGPEAGALRHLFFAEREAGKMPGLDLSTARTIKTVAVVGVGTMGAGIACCFADAGIRVRLADRDSACVAEALERIRTRYDARVASRRLEADEASNRLALLSGTADLDDLASADLVVEAVFEDLALKQRLFARLSSITQPGAILATNTSYLDIDRIADAMMEPRDILGLHFFNPAHAMRLLEIVRGKCTSPVALATALALSKRLGKVAVVARSSEGFIGNRLYAAYRQQCEFMLEEGAYPEEVDAALEQFGFAMGPFAVGDSSGLDIAWRMRQRLATDRDPRQRYCDIPDRLCIEGRFGRKTGAGWYRYGAPGAKPVPDPYVRSVIEAASKARALTRRRFTREEIQWRALATIVNEAGLLLAEGVAQRPSDVDVVLVNGYGFPKHEGGPLFWAQRQHPTRLRAAIDNLAEVTGFGFRRADLATLRFAK